MFPKSIGGKNFFMDSLLMFCRVHLGKCQFSAVLSSSNILWLTDKQTLVLTDPSSLLLSSYNPLSHHFSLSVLYLSPQLVLEGPDSMQSTRQATCMQAWTVCPLHLLSFLTSFPSPLPKTPPFTWPPSPGAYSFCPQGTRQRNLSGEEVYVEKASKFQIKKKKKEGASKV